MTNKSKKRKLEIAVISDIHLGTYGCHAKEVLRYLRSIDPKILVLNGDIIDIWQFSKWYWPKSHMKVVKQIMKMAAKKCKVYYITGNHDEMIRKFNRIKIGQLQIINELRLTIDGQKMWFFHGDIFDVVIQNSKWLAKLGAIGYDTLILLNKLVNLVANFFGKKKVSLSKKIKNNVKNAVKHINNFEETAANFAMNKEFDFVLCGHIHQPVHKKIQNETGKTIEYLNSGDWIENLTALEYNRKKWSIYRFHDDPVMKSNGFENEEIDLAMVDLKNKAVFNLMFQEINN